MSDKKEFRVVEADDAPPAWWRVPLAVLVLVAVVWTFTVIL